MPPESSAIHEAAQALKDGQLVAFPTETVYGLGADASNPDALKLLYKVKGRPSKHPAIVHLGSSDQLIDWCSDIPETAELLARLFWPGPLTLVLKKAPHVLAELTGGQDTVGIRIPQHATALALLNAFGSGVAAPSANRFGRLSATSAHDVRAEFDSEVKIVLNGGDCQVGIESTIVDLSGSAPRILRPGMILAESIKFALSEIGVSLEEANNMAGSDIPRVSGSLASHYAPRTELRLIDAAELNKTISELESTGKKVAVLAMQPNINSRNNWVNISKFPATYAHALYRNLRQLDELALDIILAEMPPQESDWTGINDRLKRAAGVATKCEGEDE